MQEFKRHKPCIGDKIIVVKETNILRSTVPIITSTHVTTVGSKYFVLESFPTHKFHIDSKEPHKDVNAQAFPSSITLYPSNEVYLERVRAKSLLMVLANQLGKMQLNKANAMQDVPADDIAKACELLGINTGDLG